MTDAADKVYNQSAAMFYVGKFGYELAVAKIGKREGGDLKSHPFCWNGIIIVKGVYKTLQNLPVTIFIHTFAAVINE